MPSAPTFASVEAPRDWRHSAWLAAGSFIVHLGLILATMSVGQMPGPSRRFARGPDVRVDVTPLVAPPATLTQRAPNTRKLTEEFDISSLPPRPAQRDTPSTPGAASLPQRQFRPPTSQPAGAPAPRLEATAPEAPQLRAATNVPAPLGQNIPGPPPPQLEPVEKPKIAFEQPGARTGAPASVGRVPLPKPATSVQEAVRQAARGSGGGLVVGDDDASMPGATGPRTPGNPLPGRLGSAVELLSDPQGVDFWPYMVKVLAAVRRNWFAVIPESARLGRQGRVVVQFAINKDGTVPKLVIASPSGADALDRAAVAGVSASNPFPPLPAEFRGSQVRLQFVFRYNVR